MVRLVAVVLVLTTSAVGASGTASGEYFVQVGAFGCTSPAALAHTTPATCRYLPNNTRVRWDGHRIDSSGLPSFDGDKARVLVEGRQMFVYANFLSPIPFADPLRRDFIVAHDSVACVSDRSLDEAFTAFSHGDHLWLAEAQCISVPAGTRAVRAEPAVAGTESVWRVRLYFGDSRPQNLWMARFDLH